MPPVQSYMVRLIEDAGGSYVYPQNRSNASVAVDLEEAYLLANGADFWINVGACNNLSGVSSPRIRNSPKSRPS